MITIDKDMIIGVGEIDRQHIELLNMINDFTSKDINIIPKEDVERTLKFLGAYVVKHFADEEKLQEECNYPDYEKHRQLHEKFVREFGELCEMFTADGPSPTFTRMLSNSVVRWVVKHIKGDDAEFGKYYNLQKSK
ncbi:MAG: hemerythrin family protein [Oscillospiraceae bacterium]|nr:hemerythrin family protein [Oscillospiraceae bacterium]